MIDAYSLGKIPRWHPEEVNQVSLADRMLRLENRVTGLQEVVERHAAENIVTKEILDLDMSFASAVKRGQSRSPPPQSVSPPGGANNDPPPVDGSGDENTSVPDEDNVNASRSVLDKQDSKTRKNPDAPSALPLPRPPRRDHPPRGRGRDRSRGSVNPCGFSRGGVSMVRGRGVSGRDNSLHSRSGWDWSNELRACSH